jgi:F-type H+-transporting ATPase subunit delta
MSSYKLSHRYAKSLIDLALEKQMLDKIHTDVVLIDATISASRDLVSMLRSPVIPSDKKLAVIEALFKAKVTEFTWAFLELVVKKGRESHLVEFGESFITQYNKLRGISKVAITTAVALDAETLNNLKNSVSAIPGIGTLEIESKVNEALIGGFMLQYGDKLYDASVSRKLKNLKEQFIDESFVGKI